MDDIRYELFVQVKYGNIILNLGIMYNEIGQMWNMNLL